MTNWIVPRIDKTKCIGCGDCNRLCPHHALHLVDGEPIIDLDRCTYCGTCEQVCPVGAIALPYEITWINRKRKV